MLITPAAPTGVHRQIRQWEPPHEVDNAWLPCGLQHIIVPYAKAHIMDRNELNCPVEMLIIRPVWRSRVQLSELITGNMFSSSHFEKFRVVYVILHPHGFFTEHIGFFLPGHLLFNVASATRQIWRQYPTAIFDRLCHMVVNITYTSTIMNKIISHTYSMAYHGCRMY